MKDRVQKIVASTGKMSRRQVEREILAGNVRINGQVASLGQKADLSDEIYVGDQKIDKKCSTQTWAFYKPRRVICTRHDPEGRPTVMDYFPGEAVYPVGRLDFESEGLLLMTNDGELAHRLTHPKFEIAKVYEVDISARYRSRLTGIQKRLIEGLDIGDGIGRFEKVDLGEENQDRITLRILVREGRNRFIRRMLEALGIATLRLKRISVGEHRLGNLLPGQSKLLANNLQYTSR